jgi:hypothetical protein
MYTVGQVLYFILSKKNQVYPMQIVEIITKRTLTGEDISYVLQAGPEKESKVTFDQVDGEVFESPDLLRRTLVSRATDQVNKLVDSALSKSTDWYGTLKESPQTIQNLPDFVVKTEQPQPAQSHPEEDESTVTLPDGSVVRVRLPAIMRESV